LRKLKVLLCFILFSLSGEISAQGVNLYGVGTKQLGTANSPSLFADPQGRIDPFLNHTVPALLAYIPRSAFGYTFLGAHSFFRETSFIIQQDPTGQSTWNPPEKINGKFDPNMVDLFLQGIALAVPIGKSPKVVIGFSAMVPVFNLMLMDSGNPYLPRYFLYDTAAHRPQIHFNGAYALNERLSFALGINLYTTIKGATEVAFQPSGPPGPSSSQRLEVKPKQKFSPLINIIWKTTDSFSNSFNIRIGAKWENDIDVITTIIPVSPATIRMKNSSLSFYDPTELEWNTTIKFSKDFYLLGGLAFQFWNNYKTPRMRIEPEGGSPFVINDAEVVLRNILIPRLGFINYVNDHFAFRGGVSLRPSPFRRIPAGNYNPVDANTLVYGAGINFDVGHPMKMKYPLEMDFSAQLHQLLSRSVNKPNPLTIGSPGYKVGGFVASYGLSATTQF